MKITLGQLTHAKPALEKLLNCALPIKTAFRFSKLVKLLQDELTIHEEQRVKLVKKYGVEMNEDGRQDWKVTPENLQHFIKDMDELNGQEVEIKFDAISIDDLGDDAKLSAIEMLLVEQFVAA